MKKIITLFLFLLSTLSGYSSHLRAGEISYKSVPGQPNTFVITLTIYTNTGSSAGVGILYVNMGDGNTLTLTGNNALSEIVGPGIRKSIFTITHSYPGYGSYIISTAPVARNYGITNLPGNSNYGMYIEAMLTSGMTPMNSPVLTFPPIGDGCLNSVYKINPGAIDPDGDVLSFKLIRCRSINGSEIPTYLFPDEMDTTATFDIDSRTGVITWKKPTIQGEYNIAIMISKYRNGQLVGYVMRDMQVTISPCINNPPYIDPVPDLCVQAGTPITYKIISHDPDKDSLTFETIGTPYLLTTNPATYTPDVVPKGQTSGTFTWNTQPLNLARNPYQIYYQVTNYHNGASSLTDIVSNFITLIAPPVKNVFATQRLHGFDVRWDKTVIPQAIGYNIYRKEGTSTFQSDSCTLGLPAGFTLAGSVNSQNTLTNFDNNSGKGLASGHTYCYIVTTVFEGGGESAPSAPSCAPLMIPFIRFIQDTLLKCVGNTVAIDSSIIVFEGADSYTHYKWTTTSSLQITNADKKTPEINVITPGFFAVKIVANSFGAYTDSATLYFDVRPIPTAEIKVVDLGGMPDTVMFYNRSVNTVSAEWLFWDGTRSKSMDSVKFIFDHNGYFRTYLTVYNSLDCPDTTSILYRVTMKGLAIPNAFEPENPDVQLNTFKPKALGLKTFFMGIWDLWGNLIWSTDKVNQYQEPLEGWNGNDSKGEKMPSQNYIWRMNATFLDGVVWKGVKDHFGNYHKEGTFTLLR